MIDRNKERYKKKDGQKVRLIERKIDRKKCGQKDSTANVDLLKSVPVEILLNFGNYFCTLQLGF